MHLKIVCGLQIGRSCHAVIKGGVNKYSYKYSLASCVVWTDGILVDCNLHINNFCSLQVEGSCHAVIKVVHNV